MKTKIYMVLFLGLLLVPVLYKTDNIAKGGNINADSESGAPDYGKIKDCPCQDEEWVSTLTEDVDKFYRGLPADKRPAEGWQRRNYNAGAKARREIRERGGIEVMRSFSGLSPLFYDQDKGFDNSRLLRKERLLEKWAPNIVMFKDDFKPVSIKRIFEIATVYIYSNDEVAIKHGEGLPGILRKIEDKTGKDSFCYKVVPKEFSDLNRYRSRYRLYDEGIIDRGDKNEIDMAMENFVKEGERAYQEYQKAVKDGNQAGLHDPGKLTPHEIQRVLSELAPGLDNNSFDETKTPRYTYLSLDRHEIMDLKKDYATEAHVYGVVKEFIMDDGYEYASLQFHLSQLNSFLPDKILYWHQGDTEKGQIVLRRPRGASDDDYRFYGAECSQHYYATSYFTGIFPAGMLRGEERFYLYVSNGSHASQLLPGYHLSAKNQWGPYAEHKFIGKKLYRDTFTDPWKLKTLYYTLQGKLIDRAPSLHGKEENEIVLQPVSFSKLEDGRLKDEELNSKYVLHSNYPDNSWIWMGFSDADRDFHLGAKSIRPGGSGPPLPKYFADLPGKSFFCNPVDHFYYYFRPTEKIAEVAAKLNNAPDTVDLVISYGKLYRLLYEAIQRPEEDRTLVKEITLAADEAIEYQAESAMKFVRQLSKGGTRQPMIDEEKKRVGDILTKLQDYIRPGNAQTNEGWLKLLNEIKAPT